jgi:iron(III) transport system substrate-binding protein
VIGGLTRRTILCFAAIIGAVGVASSLTSCGEGPADLVLYSSVDDYLLREVVDAFEAKTGLKVDVLGDTELTKTTGLMQRLIAEKSSPRADVWWSCEPFASVTLAREGVLAQYTSAAAEASFEGGWPKEFRASDKTWYAFALRARVIAYNPDILERSRVPDTIGELTRMEWRERVGIARPRFGTTRGHLAAIAATDGPEALNAWLVGMKANTTLVYRSNSAVANGVALEIIPVGLCDTDDVWVMKRDGHPIEFVYERKQEGGPTFGPGMHGPLVIPNTIGLVRGAPNTEAAERFIDFVLSPEVERMMANSDSHNVPVHPEIAAEFPEYAIPNPWVPDYEAAADSMDVAMELCEKIFVGW